jgi:omega-6 fatty acid desaturase (delta-12 desaturase)
MFQEVKPMTLFGSLRSLGLRLWDESSKKLIGWRQLHRVRHERSAKVENVEPRRDDADTHETPRS